MTDLAEMLGIDAPSEEETQPLVYILEFDSVRVDTVFLISILPQ